MADAWQSNRLIYRAVEDSDDDLFTAAQQNSEIFLNIEKRLPNPKGKRHGKAHREWAQQCHMSAIICLKPTPSNKNNDASNLRTGESPEPTPIGFIHINDIPVTQSHHGCGEIGISLLTGYCGQGYGSEAILWCLRWAFEYANLHRIEIRAFEWNEGAWKLYERLGFVPEGRKRKEVWYKGRYWDGIELGMLAEEWRERYGSSGGEVVG